MAALVEIGGTDRRFQLGDMNAIGRDPTSAVCLSDPMVSLQHAQIRRDANGRFVLVDLGTRRGVFHQDRRVSSAVLAHGDEILVGPVRLRFEDTKPSVPPVTVTPPVHKTAAESRPGSDLKKLEIERLLDENNQLRAAVELSQALSDARDMPSLLNTVLNMALRLVGADRAAIAIFAPNSAHPILKMGRRYDGTKCEVTLSTSLMSEVMLRKEGVITWDSLGDENINRAASLLAQHVRSALCVPLLHRDELVGIIHLDSLLMNSAFQNKDLQLIAAIASQAAAAIKSALLAEEVKQATAMERERLARLVGDLPDGVVLLDETQRVVMANPRGDELLKLLEFGSSDQPIEMLGHLFIGNLAGRPPVELVISSPVRRVLMISAHQSGNGEILLVLRDVTAEREKDARTAQQNRLALIGQLAGGVAHDFNNLLAVIVNAADFVRDGVKDAKVLEDVDHIVEASRRAAELVRQLLTLGSGQRVRARVVHIDSVFVEMEKLLRRTLPERVSVGAEAAPGLWRAKVDPTGLQQVLLNLAVNARDAMPEGGKLRLVAKNSALDETAAHREGVAAGNYVEVCVIDTGSGMSNEVAERIFEPFFTTKEIGKGTGLGLATAYRILQQAGGSISVKSEVGKGSTFRLLFPATEDIVDTEELASTGSVNQENSRQHTVLVAEDEPAVRKLVARILKESGYRVLEASSGEEALRAAATENSVDLLLSDLVMPGMSGKELAQALLQSKPETRVLFMSGYFEEKAGGLGTAAFLGKPFNRPELLSQVRTLLESSPGRLKEANKA